MKRSNERAPQRAASLILKRSVLLSGRKTSVSLEEPFWEALGQIAEARGTNRSKLIGSIDQKRVDGNLSSALRLFVLEHFRNASGEGVSGEATKGTSHGPARA
jgi:predicted DNA-binding ribbon-helix-helix protein